VAITPPRNTTNHSETGLYFRLLHLLRLFRLESTLFMKSQRGIQQ
jgi:hypothetical protein